MKFGLFVSDDVECFVCSSIENFTGLVIILSPIVMEAEGLRILRAIKVLRCFTGRFTVLTESKRPNSIVTGVV